jgi:hypothetical protein
MITDMSTIVATPDQVSSKVGNEAVVLNIKTGIYFGLNDVGAVIWGLIQEPVPVARVIQALLDEYDVDPKQCRDEVLNLMKDLSNAALIEVMNGKNPQLPEV